MRPQPDWLLISTAFPENKRSRMFMKGSSLGRCWMYAGCLPNRETRIFFQSALVSSNRATEKNFFNRLRNVVSSALSFPPRLHLL